MTTELINGICVDEDALCFLTESREMLEEVEPQLIGLEKQSNGSGVINTDIVNQVFRLFHSLKGSAGFLQFNSVVSLAHTAETLLDQFRKGDKRLEEKHTDVLCRVCDVMHKLLNNIESTSTDAGNEQAVRETCEQLQIIIDEDTTGSLSETGGSTGEIANSDTPAFSLPDEEIQIPELTVSPEMQKHFIQESGEQLELVEQALLELEKSPDNSTLIEEAFRSLHSFKGNCGFMGQNRLEKISHRMESILGGAKDGAIPANQLPFPVLLHVLDTLRDSVERMNNDGDSGEIDNFSLLMDLLKDTIPESQNLNDMNIRPEIAQPEALFILRDKDEDTASSKKASGSSASETPAGQAAKARAANRQDIRVDLTKLDHLINLVGELVTAEAMVTKNPDVVGKDFENFERATVHLGKIVRELQDVAVSVRMIPIAGPFRKMIRLVRDLSTKSSKKIDLILRGESTEIDKTVIEFVADPLVHLVRNSVDHGIEPPDVRKKAGKEETGKIILEAKHEGGEVWISITDDGRGLDREKILQKAIERNMVTGDGSELSDGDIYKLVFEPGFSTAEKVTDVSGRGVGMDVVKKNLERIKGRVDIRSSPGRGTEINLRIPLTLAIMQGMMVRVGQTRYTLPLHEIRESIQISPDKITIAEGRELVRVRDRILPVIRLHKLHGLEPDSYELSKGLLVILEYQTESICLLVDEVMGEHQAVVKGLSNYIGNVKGVSGCTILGDGQISLILDVGGLIKRASSSGSAENVTYH